MIFNDLLEDSQTLEAVVSLRKKLSNELGMRENKSFGFTDCSQKKSLGKGWA